MALEVSDKTPEFALWLEPWQREIVKAIAEGKRLELVPNGRRGMVWRWVEEPKP